MKRILLSLFFALVAVVSWAYDVEIDGIYYNVNKEDKSAEVTWGREKYKGDIVIPSSFVFDGVTYSVTSIGVFASCYNLTSITIPNSVTSIGVAAFYSCIGLASITIPNSVTSIGEYAFKGCSNLPVENNLRYADTYLAGVEEKNEATYIIKEGTRFIGSSAFSRCTNLTSIIIPNSVTSIGDYAFHGCI